MLSDQAIQAAIDRLVLDGILNYKKPPIKITVDEKDFEVTSEEIKNCIYRKSDIIISNDSIYLEKDK